MNSYEREGFKVAIGIILVIAGAVGVAWAVAGWLGQ